MSLLATGSKIGRFQIKSVLGQGAMGVVYLAHDPEIGRDVAIKTVRPEGVGGESAQELEARFLKEAKLAGRLQHPNIVTIFDVGRQGDTCFIAMEHVDGSPLTRYLGAIDALPLAARIAIVRQVAEALGHAHERGVLHRDVKPGNILVGKDGRVKVTDFGIGKFTEASTSNLTRTGHMIGSPAYMSPEQVKGEKLDGRSDLFSLGVVLYELLTGARPFPGESITTLVYQILHTEPRDPLERNASLPVATREVIAHLLAKAPEKRPQDAHAFVRELARIEKIQRESELTRRVLAGTPPSPAVHPAATRPASAGEPSAPAPPPGPSDPAGQGFRTLALVLVAALVVLAVLLVHARRPGVEPIAASLPPTVAAPVSMPATPAPMPTPAEAPSPAPAETPAAAAIGAPAEPAEPTVPKPRATSKPRTAPAPRVAVSAAPAAAAPAATAAPSKPDRVDARYETRRAVRFTSSPQQARLYLDGRYIGIADDWDNRGGGKELEPGKAGTHYVRMELPGYRPMTIEIEVTPDAGKDSPSVDEELDRREHVAYDKLPAPYASTTGAVEFDVEPSGAVIMESGKEIGSAGAFGPASPLQLKGPAVHDLLLVASGFRPQLVRILVAPNAGKDRATVKVKLKAD
ncbi:MAG TPA: serine/threonine-protein kinase [Thermoanaerobaculia bacterium]|nr:serine/threonine-protein kinase [Thermoanaerobaculia bacterium]